MATRLSPFKAKPLGSTRPAGQIGHALDTGAFFILLMVVAMRPLLSETYESALNPIAQVTDFPDTTTPATTAWFDLFIWLAAIAATVSALIRRSRWRWTGLGIGILVLLLAAVISTITADNKRLAINASCDWLSALVMMITLVNLCRDRLHVALLLTVITASGLASTAKCLMQVGVEFTETRDHYLENKVEFWKEQGVPADDSRVELFERRLDAREASGFFAHSNAQGAWLMLAGFAALALVGMAWGFRSARVIFSILAIILFSSIWTTGSMGAIASAAIGLVLLLLLKLSYQRIRPYWRSLLVGFWITVITIGAAVVALGASRGGLPGSSLTFRWNYWQVTSRIIAGHPWTGVGALNFDRAYMALKPVEYPEEIKDPHNFVMAILSQWGIPGGVGLGLLLIGASVVIARTLGPQDDRNDHQPVPDNFARSSLNHWSMALLVGFILLRLGLFSELWTGNDAQRAYAFLDMGSYGLIWLLCMLIILRLVDMVNVGKSAGFRLTLLCGVLAFLLQNTIDHSLFLPGSLTPFVAMSGLLLAHGQSPRQDQPQTVLRFGSLSLALCGTICLLLVSFVPVSRSSNWLSYARNAPLTSVEHGYLSAAAADPLDPTPLAELAAWHARIADQAVYQAQKAQHEHQSDDQAAFTEAIKHLNSGLIAANEAINRDPDQSGLYQLRSQLLEMRYRVGGSKVDLWASIGAARQAVKLYPQSPDKHLELAELLARAVAEPGFAELALEARRHYQHALELNNIRPVHEIRRWSPEKQKWIEGRIQALESSVPTQPESAAS